MNIILLSVQSTFQLQFHRCQSLQTPFLQVVPVHRQQLKVSSRYKIQHYLPFETFVFCILTREQLPWLVFFNALVSRSACYSFADK